MAAKELLNTVTVEAGGAATIVFSNFPSDGTDLLVVLSARDTTTNGNAFIALNGDTTGTNYARRMLIGNGVSASSTTSSAKPYVNIALSTATAGVFGSSQILLPAYSATGEKVISVQSVSESNSSTGYANLVSGNWTGTAAITSVTLTKDGVGSFAEGTTASLYKITKGSGGATVA